MADDLDLGVIGNCAYALIDRSGEIVWYCLTCFDGDPVFVRLLDRALKTELASFVESFDGGDLDAGLLLMSEVGFLRPTISAGRKTRSTSAPSAKSRFR